MSLRQTLTNKPKEDSAVSFSKIYGFFTTATLSPGN